MKKRDFLKISTALTAGIFLSPTWACKTIQKAAVNDKFLSEKGEFVLPALNYAFTALEPHIDAKTMEIHHDKHHAAYVKKLNEALKGSKMEGKTLGEIFQSLQKDAPAIRNNAGGHYNHSLFWQILSPTFDTKPEGKLLEAINKYFTSPEKLLEQMKDTGMKVFGSGWVWLCVAPNKELFICSTPNQDNPLMMNLVERTGTPILGIDVWEHAYYLKYQNKRKDYLEAIVHAFNWAEIGKRYEAVIA